NALAGKSQLLIIENRREIAGGRHAPHSGALELLKDESNDGASGFLDNPLAPPTTISDHDGKRGHPARINIYDFHTNRLIRNLRPDSEIKSSAIIGLFESAIPFAPAPNAGFQPKRVHHLWIKGDRKSTRLNSSHVKISYA